LNRYWSSNACAAPYGKLTGGSRKGGAFRNKCWNRKIMRLVVGLT
jgi:hypothetical protein